MSDGAHLLYLKYLSKSGEMEHPLPKYYRHILDIFSKHLFMLSTFNFRYCMHSIVTHSHPHPFDTDIQRNYQRYYHYENITIYQVQTTVFSMSVKL